jgi:K+-sensing histidine kinase KdpD
MSSENPRSEPPTVPWSDIVKFVRQLGHDIRNNLNAVELQSSYLAELANELEIKGEISRLREIVSEMSTSLQKLTAKFSQTNPMLIPYRVADLIEDLKQKLANDFADNAKKVTWDVQVKDEKLEIDPQMVLQALLELFANAFQHERDVKAINAKAFVQNRQFVFELREPKTKFELSTKSWGYEPLRHVSSGHYGLGLNRTRIIAEVHGGKFDADYEGATSTLVTRVTLPVS